MKTVMIVQARSGSTRLPGKALLPLAGEPMLFRLIERLRRCSSFEAVILATTLLPEDDQLAVIAKRQDCIVYRGSENDLIERICGAANMVGADVIARYPADNALPEPAEIDRIVNYFHEGEYDFASNLCNVLENNYPDGIGAEVFRCSTLEMLRREERNPSKREHVTPCFYDYSRNAPVSLESFKIGTIPCPKLYRRSDLKMCVDTPEEYEYIARMYSDIYPFNPQFSFVDVISWNDQINVKKVG